jgi:hypothetical protein
MKTAPGPPWRPGAVAYGMVSGDHLDLQPYYNQKARYPPNWRNGHSESAVLKVPYGIGQIMKVFNGLLTYHEYWPVYQGNCIGDSSVLRRSHECLTSTCGVTIKKGPAEAEPFGF